MESEDGFALALDSECFRFLCTKLNASVKRENATWSVDILAGGFKYCDEIPDGLSESSDVLLPLITLLRRLWGYRASLVEEQPRLDLALTWELARKFAPNWAGFTPERCSPSMKPVLDHVKIKDIEFAHDMERLERG